jgi:hypothetical protein
VRVFNLTKSRLDFRGRVIPADGGFLDYPELDTFIPDRDKALARSGIISFGTIPPAWQAAKAQRIVEAAKAIVAPAQRPSIKVSDEVAPPGASFKISEVPWKSARRKGR